MSYGNKSIESTTAGDSLFFKFECLSRIVDLVKIASY